MVKTLTIGVDMVSISCGAKACDMQFAVPTSWYRARQADEQTWYCPNGHARVFTGQTEEQKLRAQLAETERRLRWRSERAERLANDNMTLAKSRSALRGVVTRLKNKAAAGLCQWCDHSFPDVAAHVAEAHPGIATEATDEDEATPPAADSSEAGS